MQPGQTINPGNPSTDKPEEPTKDSHPLSDESPVVSYEEDQKSENAESTDQNSPLKTQDSQPEWQYTANDQSPSDQPAHLDIPPITWSASEFIDHDKRASWFMGLAAATVVACIVIYVVTQDIIATAMIVIAAALFGVTASRKPNTLEYRLDASGIKIASKQYPYDKFKSFSVIEEGALDSIQLSPLARLAPPISLYYPPEQEEQILNTLANYLPHEDRRHDPVDRLMRRIRF